jgi:hypothetical protein
MRHDLSELTQQEESPETSDIGLYHKLRNLLEEMSGPEKMALGLHAFWLIDTSYKQLCQVQPRYSEFSAKLNEAIALVRQLQPQTLAEVANEILLEDWETDSADAPSITIE